MTGMATATDLVAVALPPGWAASQARIAVASGGWFGRAGHPLTDVLEEQTSQALDGVVERFRINWVWMPPWGPERITDDGRDMMRALGFAI